MLAALGICASLAASTECTLTCLSVDLLPFQALEQRSVLTYKSHVLVAHTEAFNGVTTVDFINGLATSLKPNHNIVKMFRSLPALEPACDPNSTFTAPPDVPLKMSFVMEQIQGQLLGGDEPMALLVDTGDSLFR